ncbi:MAG TPA: 3'-5' exonuclease [Aggregatilineales bacterium]|nr:3'-5' exonuclease [Aggregatilineales bacterium]
MNYIIVDLEATCWKTGTDPARQEIIEIGAVMLTPGAAQPMPEFARFVRPVNEPVLSDFCVSLTGITQADVDGANPFDVVFGAFVTWIAAEPFTLCSWGAYDLNQFRVDCSRHQIALPTTFERHINLKKAFAQWKGIKPCGMKAALEVLNLPLEGKHHRGIDDARNIAKIAQAMLPYLRDYGGLSSPTDYSSKR